LATWWTFRSCTASGMTYILGRRIKATSQKHGGQVAGNASIGAIVHSRLPFTLRVCIPTETMSVTSSPAGVCFLRPTRLGLVRSSCTIRTLPIPLGDEQYTNATILRLWASRWSRGYRGAGQHGRVLQNQSSEVPARWGKGWQQALRGLAAPLRRSFPLAWPSKQ
jgi:hypothetical protein